MSGEIKAGAPGVAPPTDLEVQVKKAKDKISGVTQGVTETVDKTVTKFTMPTTNEWQFWVGLILLVSLGTSFLASVSANSGSMYDNSASFSDLSPNGRI